MSAARFTIASPRGPPATSVSGRVPETVRRAATCNQSYARPAVGISRPST